MLYIILAVVALFAVLGLGRLLLFGVVPRYHLSPDDLGRYIGYLAKALDERGYVEIGGVALPGSLLLQRLRGDDRDDTRDLLVLRLSVGPFQRRQLRAIAGALLQDGIRHEVRRGVLGRLREIRISFPARSPETAGAVAQVVTRLMILPELGGDARGRLTIVCRGPFRPPHGPEDGRVIRHPAARRLGFALGRAAGSFLSHLRR